MSDEIDRAAERAKLEAREGDLVSARIFELRVSPIEGRFDATHLQAIHAYIFQDTPRHYPGIIRDDTGLWSKQRALEGAPGTYEVAYLGEGVAARISEVLQQFGGPDALRGLSVEDAASKLAKLYGDLDHAHGFFEGNSRTLREFTRELTDKAGFSLDWTGTNVTASVRNHLYAARDLEVITRHYPGVTAENAQNRFEFEAAMQADSFRKQLGETPLLDLIRKGLATAQTERQVEGQAQAFDPKSYITSYANRAAPDQRPKPLSIF